MAKQKKRNQHRNRPGQARSASQSAAATGISDPAKQRRKRPGQGKPPTVQPLAPSTESGQKTRQGRSVISFLGAVCVWAYRHLVLNVVFWVCALSAFVGLYALRPKVTITIEEAVGPEGVFYNAKVHNEGEFPAQNVNWRIHIESIQYSHGAEIKNITIPGGRIIERLNGGIPATEIIPVTHPFLPGNARIVRGRIQIEKDWGIYPWDLFRGPLFDSLEAFRNADGVLEWRPGSLSKPSS